jgi:DNA-binding SARP family transcriptional activator
VVGSSRSQQARDGPLTRRMSSASVRLRLLNAFELICDGGPVPLPMSAQRVVAFLALHDRPLLRSYVAGSLWLDTTDERAQANLRSALWRLHRCSHQLVEAAGQRLALGTEIEVDLRVAEVLARRALRENAPEDLELDAALLASDLLPDWYDDWVLLEREQFRQLRLHALDVLCERLTREGRLGEALDVGLTALVGEPLRESAHRAVIRIHLADGNRGEAMRQYRLCRRLLGELGIQPSGQTEALAREVTTAETVA